MVDRPCAAPAGPPRDEPIGLAVARAGKDLDRAFEQALAAAGGSRPTWLILLSVVSGASASQSALAERLGITGPTLVHHLDRLEAAGLISRRLDPGNRRVRALELTDEGQRTFHRLREAAMAFDARLRGGIEDTELDTVRRVLAALRTNATAPAGARSGTHEPEEENT
jgi:MarR family transcriptional regulator for hemolysin